MRRVIVWAKRFIIESFKIVILTFFYIFIYNILLTYKITSYITLFNGFAIENAQNNLLFCGYNATSFLGENNI